MSDKRWKATERRIAALLGGRRVPVSGRGRGDQPDIAHPWLSLEIKDRATLPFWLLDALDQAERSVTAAQRPGAVLHRAGDRHDAALVVLRLANFVDWCGGVQRVSVNKGQCPTVAYGGPERR
jgi:hypothetical protein